MCKYCGAAKGEYCGMKPGKVYKGGTCPARPSLVDATPSKESGK